MHKKDHEPLMKRFDEVLEKHGLSLGDALNLALFALTIISLVVALVGLRIARITLDEAAKAATSQDNQFAQQIKQLTASTATLETARQLLIEQGTTLRDLQMTSKQQLADLDEQQRHRMLLERAAPQPTFDLSCDDKDLVRNGASLGKRAVISGIEQRFVKIQHANNAMDCAVVFRNKGDADMRNTTISVRVSRDYFVAPGLTGDVYLSGAGDTKFGFPGPDRATLLTGANIPSGSRRQFLLPFRLQRADRCLVFDLELSIESDTGGADFPIFIAIEDDALK